MAALRLLLVAVCLMFMILPRVSAGAADCHAELTKCQAAQMVNLNYTTMMASPEQAIAAICHDDALREEAEAFACGAQALQKEVCNVPSMATAKVIFGGMAESRIEAALRYGCDNVLALVRVARCMPGYDQTKFRECGDSPKIQKVTEAQAEGTTPSRADMCGAFSVATGCINDSVFTKCYAADLKVARTLMADIMPEGCVSASGHLTTNVAILILTALVVKIGIW